MRRIITALLALSLVIAICCAPDGEPEQPSKPSAPAVEIKERSQSVTLGPWVPWESFNETVRSGNYYLATTRPSFSQALSSRGVEYEIGGWVRSTDNISFPIGPVDWSLTFSGAQNPCVIYGCTLILCLGSTTGWEWCTQVIGQGATSWTMTLFGRTYDFWGKSHPPFDWKRWSMFVNIDGSGALSHAVTDFSVAASNP